MYEDRFPDPLFSLLGINAGRMLNNLFMPAMDVAVVADAILFRLDVPGMSAQEIAIEHRGRTLIVRGARSDDLADVRRLTHERRFGSFERQLELPANAQLDEVTATCLNGVLTVTVPLAQPPQAETRQIPVSDG